MNLRGVTHARVRWHPKAPSRPPCDVRAPDAELHHIDSRELRATIAGRRGKRIAVVALARRLAGIVYAMWRDGARMERRSARRAARRGRRSAEPGEGPASIERD